MLEWSWERRARLPRSAQSQPSTIDELVRLVHPRDGHKKVLAMIDAYLDESGIHDGSKVCVIAGYFGGPGQMKRFEKAWKETLARYSFPMKVLISTGASEDNGFTNSAGFPITRVQASILDYCRF